MILAAIHVDIERAWEPGTAWEFRIKVYHANGNVSNLLLMEHPDHMRSNFDYIWQEMGKQLKSELEKAQD